MKIIITEEQLDYLKSELHQEKNNTIEVFNKEIRLFIYNLINKSIDSISDYWRINGIKKNELFGKLKTFNIVIDKDGELLVPKKNFENKIKRLYNELFPSEEPGLIISEDDGGGMCSDGATTAISSGSYEGPLSNKPLRKKF